MICYNFNIIDRSQLKQSEEEEIGDLEGQGREGAVLDLMRPSGRARPTCPNAPSTSSNNFLLSLSHVFERPRRPPLSGVAHEAKHPFGVPAHRVGARSTPSSWDEKSK